MPPYLLCVCILLSVSNYCGWERRFCIPKTQLVQLYGLWSKSHCCTPCHRQRLLSFREGGSRYTHIEYFKLFKWNLYFYVRFTETVGDLCLFYKNFKCHLANNNISVYIILIWTSLLCFITLSLAKRTVKNFTIIFFSLVSCFNGGSSGSVDNSMTKWQSNKTLILPIKKLTTTVAINLYSLGQNYLSNGL